MKEIYFELLSYPYTPYDGAYRWHGQPPSQDIIRAVEALPVAQEAFLNLDLDTDAAVRALAALVGQDRLLALKAHQCQLVRSLRADAYRAEADGLFFGHEADADSQDAWLVKRAEIKERYPWPGTYR